MKNGISPCHSWQLYIVRTKKDADCACLSETPAVFSLCVNCKGYRISHGWKKRIKVTVASIDEPERHPNDDEVRDHVKQTWEKVKIDLTSDDDEAREQDDENAEMGDGEEEVNEEEEEEQDFDMDDRNAEKRDFREKDEVDDYINKEREEVENDEQEEDEIQGGKVNIRKFKAGEMQDAVEYPPWTSRVVSGSKVLPADPCMIGDAQPDLIKILMLQIGVNLHCFIKHVQRNFCGKIELVWRNF